MIGNILGEAFDPYVDEQIKVRQKIYGKTSKRSTQELTYLNGRTAWARMISSVDLIEDKQFDTGKKRLENLGVGEEYFGDGLAKNFVLFAGTSKVETTTTTDDNGVTTNQVNNPSISDLRKGINSTNILSNAAYGLGGTEFGLQPMPHLSDISITNRGEYGAYREATINVKCYNPKQFEIINILYLSVGYTVLLEWGNSCYFNNKEEFISDNTTSLQQYFFDKKNANNHIGLFQAIKAKRKEADGNFDGLFGYVTNYTWTFENGVYNIDIKLTSLGSIAESLTINTYGNTTGSNAEPQNNSITTLMNGWKSANEINYENAETKEVEKGTQITLGEDNGILTSSTTKSTLKEIAKLLNIESSSDFSENEIPFRFFNPISPKSQIDFFKFTESKIFSFSYIRFGALLEFIEKTELIYNFEGENSPQPLLKIDYDPETNFMSTFRLMIVTDPYNCIFNSGELTRIGSENPETTTQFSNLPEFKTSKYDVTVGKIMNVFLNCDMINNILNEETDSKGNLNLVKFLQSLCDKISSSVGYLSELKVSIDEENNVLKIIENGELPNKKKILEEFGGSTNYSSFDAFGYSNFNKENQSAGFVKSFNIKTQITNDIYTTAVLGAQQAGYPAKNVDSTNFSYMYRGLQDRIISYKQTISDKNIQNDSEEERIKKNLERSSKAIMTYDEILGFNKTSVVGINDRIRKFSEDDILNYKSAIQSLIEERKRHSLQVGGVSNIQYMPINFSMTLDGLSGMKIFQNFKADSKFLPYPYPEVITLNINPSIRHKISNNVWTTEVETKFVPQFVKSKNFIETTEQTTKDGFYGTNKEGIGFGVGGGGSSTPGGFQTNTKTSEQPTPLTPNADKLRLALLRITTPTNEVYEKNNPKNLVSNEPGYKNISATAKRNHPNTVGKGGQLTNSGNDITKGLALFAENVLQRMQDLYPNRYNVIVTGGNDFAHKDSTSSHKVGNGLDFVIYPNKGGLSSFKIQNPISLKFVNLENIKFFKTESFEPLDDVITIIQEFIAGESQNGIKMGYIDEYRYPSGPNVGGHIHIRYGGFDKSRMQGNKNGYQIALEKSKNGEITPQTLQEYEVIAYNPYENPNY